MLPRPATLFLFAALAACRSVAPDAAGPSASSDAPLEVSGAEMPDLDLSDLPAFLPEFDEIAGDDWLPDWDDGPARRSQWLTSGSQAIAIARREQKPIVLWMSQPAISALDVALKAEIMDTPPMLELLTTEAVGLRIDWSNPDVSRSDYYQAFRRRYRPAGYPTVLLLLPDGTESARYRGYSRGNPEGWIDRLRFDLRSATRAWQARLDVLAASGYREWQARDGGSLFAKAIARSGGEALLIDAFGRRHRIALTRFANECLSDLLDLPEHATRNP